jgi:hypothetical protein
MRILNIGLKVEGEADLVPANILPVLRRAGIGVLEWRIAPEGKSEPTFVAIADRGATKESLKLVAFALGQEAIAFYDADVMQGFVVGPQAEKWAPFKPEYFQVY